MTLDKAMTHLQGQQLDERKIRSLHIVLRKNCQVIWSKNFDLRDITLAIGHCISSFLLLLPVGHPAGLDGFVGCIDLTYLRDSLTNIRIRVLSPGRPSFRENAS